MRPPRSAGAVPSRFGRRHPQAARRRDDGVTRPRVGGASVGGRRSTGVGAGATRRHAMRIAVLGTGGIGGYFGGRLAASGHDVTFLARGAHLEAIREHGLVVTSVAGDFTVRPAQVTDDLASIGAVDAVLLAVKTWQLAPVLEK